MLRLLITKLGLSKPDLDTLLEAVENDKSLKDFALKLIRIHKADGYAIPKDDTWEAGNITNLETADFMQAYNYTAEGLLDQTDTAKHQKR